MRSPRPSLASSRPKCFVGAVRSTVSTPSSTPRSRGWTEVSQNEKAAAEYR
jgi:hypothetical protein